MAKKRKPRYRPHTQRYLDQAQEKGLDFNPSVLDVLKAQADNQARQAIRRATTAEERRKAREDYLKRQQAERQNALDNLRSNASFTADIKIAEKSPDSGPPELTASRMARLRALVAERIRRRREALKLWSPMPTQAEFQNCVARERVIYGSSRSGKTTASAVEVALICLGVHPHLSGKHLPLKNGVFMCIGYDFTHVGSVMFRKLFRPGAFRIIKDKETGEWRPYEPDGKDKGVFRGETEPAPPLIPKRMIAPGGISWYRKKEGIPRSVKLTTGWQITFYSSESDPPQGHAAHGAWVDEEMDKENWYEEIARALVDETGFFIWSATPHVGGEALIDLHKRAEEQRLVPNALTREFFLLIHDNAHISNADKRDLEKKYEGNPEAYRTRIMGQFAATAFKVYPEFNMERHGFDLEMFPNGQIPDNFCRFVAIDPGSQVCANLFFAIPPPGSSYPNRIYFYKELYITNCTPTAWATQFEQATRGEHFHALIFDMRMGRVSTVGTEEPVEAIYRKALYRVPTGGMLIGPDEKPQSEVVNVWTRVTEQMFIPGVDNPKAGIQAVKEVLVVNSMTGYSRACFARGRFPNFEGEMSKYHNRRVKGVVLDEPIKKADHGPDCLRYAICYRPEWRKPPQPQKPRTRIYNRLEEKRARLAKAGSAVVNFGPRSSRMVSSGQ